MNDDAWWVCDQIEFSLDHYLYIVRVADFCRFDGTADLQKIANCLIVVAFDHEHGWRELVRVQHRLGRIGIGVPSLLALALCVPDQVAGRAETADCVVAHLLRIPRTERHRLTFPRHLLRIPFR